MNMKNLPAGVMACMMALSVRAATNDDLLFYCAFDDTATATFARGKAAPTSEVPPEFQPGVRGQALVIGGATNAGQRIVDGLPLSNLQANNCYYSPDQNIDVSKGSVSFWLKPLDWDGATMGFNTMFRTGAGCNFFMIYRYYADDRLLFLRGEQEKWTSVERRIGDWKPGQWHHIVATWSPEEMRYFMDGALVCARKVRFPFENTAPVEPISVGPGGSWAKAFSGRSLIDEFRIYNRPLSREDVIQLHEQDAANVSLDVDYITLGERSPKLDGIIGDFEYAFACGQGFSNLKGSLSPRPSRYYLSYDRSNLYVAVVSAVDPALTAPHTNRSGDVASSERVELFLCPGNGTNAMLHFATTPDGVVYDAKYGATKWSGEPIQARSVVSDTDTGWTGDNGRKNAFTNKVWTLETAIPFAALGLNSAPDGQSWRINIARVFTSPEEATSAAPALGSLADRSHFLKLHFQPAVPALEVNGWMDARAHSDNSRSEITFKWMQDNTENYGLKAESHLLWSNGKPVRLIPSLPRTPVNKPRDPIKGSVFEMVENRVVEKRDGKETTLCRLRSIRDEQLPLTTFFLYTQDHQRLFVSAKKGFDGKIQARFLRPDLTCAWRMQQDIPRESIYFNAIFNLDFNALTPGDYTVKIDYVAPDGATTESWDQDYRVPEKDAPEFRPYIDVDADKVPAPWTPVKVSGGAGGWKVGGGGGSKTKDDPEALSVSVWGRTYDFSGGFLFSSLVSQGTEILAGPAVLRLNGTDLSSVAPAVVTPISATDLLAVWDKTSDLGALTVSNRIQTHFDGYCEIAMTLTPAGGTQTVTTLSMDIPLRGSTATLVCDGSVITGNKNGAVGDHWRQAGVDFWVGNEEVGFNWVAPSLEGWCCKNTTNNVEIIRQGDTAMLRFHLVDTPLKLDAPRTIQLGFTLTPSRPLDRRILRARNQKDWQMWCQPWKYFATPDYDTADIGDIERAAVRDGANVNDVFLYLSACFISPGHPNWGFWEEDWRQLTPRGPMYGEWSGVFGDKTFRDRCCYVSKPCLNCDRYRHFVLNTWNQYFLKAKTPLTPKATSYYFDDWRQEGSCMNARHGCVPWKDGNGVDRTRLLIDANREMALNSYRMIKRTGPAAKIAQHVGWSRCVPTQQFADVFLGGECLPGEVNGNYYAFLTPEMFRATYLATTWGVKTVFLNMLVRLMSERQPDQYVNFSLKDPETRRALLHSYGYCVVHDVDIADGHAQTEELRNTLWAAQDTLGWDENVIFHPYWKHAAIKLVSPRSPRIMASAYTKNGKMLLAVVNDTDKEETVTLDLDLPTLGVKAGLQGHDVWQSGTLYTLSSRWAAKMGPRGFQLIQWGAEQSQRTPSQ